MPHQSGAILMELDHYQHFPPSLGRDDDNVPWLGERWRDELGIHFGGREIALNQTRIVSKAFNTLMGSGFYAGLKGPSTAWLGEFVNHFCCPGGDVVTMERIWSIFERYSKYIWVPQQAGWLGACRNLVVKLFRIGSLHWVCQSTIMWRLVGYTNYKVLKSTSCRDLWVVQSAKMHFLKRFVVV